VHHCSCCTTQVALAQKWLIQKARLHSRPVLVAGQLMEGMAVSPRPSRPEITDVVNAVYDGADAVVLMQVRSQADIQLYAHAGGGGGGGGV
jgi:pyruvate kinase